MSRWPSLAAWSLGAFVRAYQLVLSPLLPRACRFDPSCSAYAHQALMTHGAVTGSLLALRRLARCHPWGGFGYDPVPTLAERAAHRHSPR